MSNNSEINHDLKLCILIPSASHLRMRSVNLPLKVADLQTLQSQVYIDLLNQLVNQHIVTNYCVISVWKICIRPP